MSIAGISHSAVAASPGGGSGRQYASAPIPARSSQLDAQGFHVASSNEHSQTAASVAPAATSVASRGRIINIVV